MIPPDESVSWAVGIEPYVSSWGHNAHLGPPSRYTCRSTGQGLGKGQDFGPFLVPFRAEPKHHSKAAASASASWSFHYRQMSVAISCVTMLVLILSQLQWEGAAPRVLQWIFGRRVKWEVSTALSSSIILQLP